MDVLKLSGRQEFIPLAEESGLIAPLGSWVLREACRQASEWITDGWADVSISVNLSARQFRQPGLVPEIEAILDETRLAPRHLTLELTETAVMDDAGQAIERLQALKVLGVRIAIDDFGTGYSSLAYLQQFPVDALKIDRRFVAGLGTNDTDAAIVRSILTLAHSLGLRVVAEGVEQAEQVTLLRALGCEQAQGFHFSRPRPADEILPLVHRAAPTR